MSAIKAICFRCQFIGIGVDGPRCPQCSFPLIMNTGPVALGAGDLERLFAHKPEPTPLPGVSAEPRSAQLRAAERKQRISHLEQAKRASESFLAEQAEDAQRAQRARRTRKRIGAELVAASCVLAGLLVTLNALGAF